MWIVLACTMERINTNDSYQWRNDTSGDSNDITEVTEGYLTGNRAPNLQSTDQQGLPWTLYDQTQPLLLLFGHMDSNSLPMMLTQIELLEQEIFSVVVVGRNIYSSPASTSDATEIANDYSLGSVLIDSNQELVNEWSQRNPPKAYLLNEEHIILWDGFQHLNTTAIDQLLSE